MAVHRWHVHAQVSASEMPDWMQARVMTLLETFLSAMFPLGVIPNSVELYDEDERRAKIETPFDEALR